MQEIYEKNKGKMIYSINEQLADMSMSQTISIEEDKEIKQANLDSGYLITYVK